MGKNKSKRTPEEGPRKVDVLKDKKVLKNIRIYKRDGPIEEDEHKSVFRRYLPQFIANFAISFILVDAALSMSFPTLVIGYAYRNNTSVPQQQKDTFLHLSIFPDITFNKLQASAYSCVQFLFVPFGSFTGGIFVDRIGRKKIMFASSVPMFLSWLLYFFSQDIPMLFFANIFSGLGLGFGESAVATYQGEVTEPRIRGTVINLSALCFSVSLLGPFVLHLAIPSWRWISLICAVVPVVSGITALLVPESPMWLLSRGQVTLAEESLYRLRGGATKQEVADEMQAIVSYHYSSAARCNRHPAQFTATDSLLSKQAMKEKWLYFKSDEVRKPFILSCVMFVLVYTTGTSSVRPYINPVLNMIHFKGSWTLAALTLSLSALLGSIFSVLVIGYTGKRPLLLSALFFNGIASLTIGISIVKSLPVLVSLILLHIMSFISGYGIIQIPWILQSEIYPFRIRGFAAGLAAGVSYLVGCIALLIFLPLTEAITLEAMFFIFFIVSLFGCVFMYFKMPETEGRHLEQIEDFFRGKK